MEMLTHTRMCTHTLYANPQREFLDWVQSRVILLELSEKVFIVFYIAAIYIKSACRMCFIFIGRLATERGKAV